MKVRILDNSIRFRLMQSEVKQFGQEGRIVAQILFGIGSDKVLKYQLHQSTEHETLSADIEDNCITIYVPQAIAQEWVSSSQVGLSHQLVIGDNQELSILIEKDFQCLTDRPGEDESDAFPNPNTEC